MMKEMTELAQIHPCDRTRQAANIGDSQNERRPQ
jgi:hypothetical protein